MFYHLVSSLYKETLIKELYKNESEQDQYRGEVLLKTYLVKMTVNRSHDYLRSWKSKGITLFEKVTGKSTNDIVGFIVYASCAVYLIISLSPYNIEIQKNDTITDPLW